MKKKLPLIARLILGLMFTVFGANGFFHFLPMPPMEGVPAQFFGGLAATGFMLPLLFGTQLVSGLLLLVGAFVPLAIVMLAPILVNILCWHIFVNTQGLGMALFVCALEAYLAFFAKPYAPIVKQIFRCPMKEAMDAK